MQDVRLLWYPPHMKAALFPLPLFVFACLLGAGCVRPSFFPTTSAPTVSDAARALQEGRVPPSEYAASGYALQSAGPADCFGVDGGRATGGDLLRTLADQAEYARIQATVKLDLVTPTSAQMLAERIEAAAPSSSRLLVHSICQVNKDVSVLTATIWPNGTPTWDMGANGMPVVREAVTQASTTVVLVTSKAIHRFDSVRPWGAGGPPGGGAAPCSAKLAGTYVSWDCSEGVVWDSKTDMPTGFEQRRTYRLPLKGGKVTSTGYRKKL